MSSRHLVAVLAVLLSTHAPAVVDAQPKAGIGDIICTSGFVMDKYCIDQEFLLDNQETRTLRHPENHSIHCLIDEEVCRVSGYNLLRPKVHRDHRLGWDIDNPEAIVHEARRVGVCQSCDNAEGSIEHGLWVEVVGEVISVHPPILHLYVAVTAPHHSDPTCPAVQDFMPSSAPSTSPSPSSAPSASPSPSMVPSSDPTESPTRSEKENEADAGTAPNKDASIESYMAQFGGTAFGANSNGNGNTNSADTKPQEVVPQVDTSQSGGGITFGASTNTNSNHDNTTPVQEVQADYNTCKHYKLCCGHHTPICTNNCDSQPACAPIPPQGIPDGAQQICEGFFGHTCIPPPEADPNDLAALAAFGGHSLQHNGHHRRHHKGRHKGHHQRRVAAADANEEDLVEDSTDFFHRKLYVVGQRRLGEPSTSGYDHMKPWLEEFTRRARAKSVVPS